jgi:hypothetical protein
MKQELKDIATQAVVSSPTSGWAVLTGLSVAEWTAIILGIAQLAYLLRKWWREETEWGIRMKRWLKKQTTPGDL